jgi:hypothetical protein
MIHNSFKAAEEHEEMMIKEQMKQLQKRLEIIAFNKANDLLELNQKKFEQKNLEELQLENTAKKKKEDIFYCCKNTIRVEKIDADGLITMIDVKPNKNSFQYFAQLKMMKLEEIYENRNQLNIIDVEELEKLIDKNKKIKA